MSDSTSHLRLMTTAQAEKEALVNALADAAAPALTLGIDHIGTTGLTLSIFGGNVLIGGTVTTLANQTAIALTNAATNYVELDPNGTGTTSGIRVNTSGWTAGYIPLWSIVCASGAISSYTDERAWGCRISPLKAIVMASDANKTLTRDEAAADLLVITSSVSLTATRNIVLPLRPKLWHVYNGTTGGQSLQFIGATGTGITVATAKRATVACDDSTNIARYGADV